MPTEPMPRWIMPMLARSGQMPSNDGDYGFEMKWDGIRAMLYIEHGRASLASRNMIDITRQYPEVLPLEGELGASQLILDGEIVAPGRDGRPSFFRLQRRMGVVSDQKVRQLAASIPVAYMIFDLLYLDGVILMDRPYADRREALRGLNLAGRAWQTPEYSEGDGRAVLAISRRLGLEGVMAKRLDSPYQPGRRTGAWIKIKNLMRQELVIGGWVRSQANPGRIGALMVGYYEAGPEQTAASGSMQKLVYAGKVGTGFTGQDLDRLAGMLQLLRRATCPFHANPGERDAVFVEPALICEVEFTQWTPHATLRHPSFKGMRNDKNPREVVREAGY